MSMPALSALAFARCVPEAPGDPAWADVAVRIPID